MIDEMNGTVPPQVEQTVSKDCIDVANLLEAIAKEARKGRYCAVGMVLVEGAGRISTPATGNMIGQQYLGADLLKQNLMAYAMGVHPEQQAKQARMPRILRPGGPASPLPPGFKFP